MSGSKDIAREIEVRLDRSLRNQVRVPKLGRKFDAAVWARIEAEESKATNPLATATPSRAVRASRWISVVNYIGVAVTLGVVAYFLIRTFGGIPAPTLDIDVTVPVEMPVIPEAMISQIVGAMGQVLGAAAVVFGLSFTALGRRVRASFW